MDKNINISGTSEERLDVFFSESTKNLFVILQLRYCDETADEAFENLEHLAEKGVKPDFTHYEAVYVGEVPPYERKNRMLPPILPPVSRPRAASPAAIHRSSQAMPSTSS